MISRLAALGAATLAAATMFAPAAPGGGADVRMEVLSATPRPPQAGRPFELVARVEFAPAPGSIRSVVRIGGERFRKMRLTWTGSIARCTLVVPAGARGKRLTIGLTATQGGSRTRTSLTFRVS
jgi:hypothetical protein